MGGRGFPPGGRGSLQQYTNKHTAFKMDVYRGRARTDVSTHLRPGHARSGERRVHRAARIDLDAFRTTPAVGLFAQSWCGSSITQQADTSTLIDPHQRPCKFSVLDSTLSR